MNDVGGTESGTGLRPKSSRGSASDTNFEYDDSEWDVGIGNLIIDLDADIEKNNEASPSSNQTQLPPSNAGSSAVKQASSSMHTSPGASTPSTSSAPNSSNHLKVGKPPNSSTFRTVNKGGSPVADSVKCEGDPQSSVNMEHSSTCVDKGLKMKIKRTKPGTKSVEAKHEIVKNDTSLIKPPGSTSAVNASSGKVVSGNSLTEANSKMVGSTAPQRSTQNKEDKTDMQASATDDGSKSKLIKRSSTPKKIKTVVGTSNSPQTVISLTSAAGSSTGKKETSLSMTDARSNVESGNSGIANTSGESSGIMSTTQKTESSASSSVQSVSSAFVKTIPMKMSLQQGGHSADHATVLQESTGPAQKAQYHPAKVPSSSVHVTPNKGDKANSSCNNGTVAEKVHSNASSKRSRGVAHQDKSSNSDADKFHISATAQVKAGKSTLVDTSNSFCNKEVQRITRTLSQSEQAIHDACVGTSVGTITEPDCLGPCEPGTSVTLEGIVWHETENGVLVVNVTWRGKTYVGSLIDCTKNEWASPRFCESPTSDVETRTPKNRAKRGRAQGSGTPVLEASASPLEAFRVSTSKLRNGTKGRRGSSGAPFLTPHSPLKVDPWPKRKTRGSENDQEEASTSSKSTKRIKISSKEGSSNSGGRNSGSPVSGASAAYSEVGPYSPTLIECPEPNCSKKYKHINGLKYHQTHAHTPQLVAAEDSDSNMSTASANNLASASNADDIGDSSIVDVIDPGVDTKADDDPEVNAATDMCNETAAASAAQISAKATDFNSYEDLGGNVKGKAKDGAPNSDGSPILSEIGQKLVNPVARTPILTIPSFVSGQNRSMAQQAPSRIGNSHGIEIQKLDGFSAAPKGNSVPWQPHSSTPHTGHLATPVISSIQSMHSQTQLLLSENSQGKELKSNEEQNKKSKHKKKSKDKRDRDRDGKTRVSGNLSRKDSEDREGSPTSTRRDERKSSSETIEDEEEGRIRVRDTRDPNSPRSPAYSDITDISDANDSGPESDLRTNKEMMKGAPPGTSDHTSLNSGNGSGPGHGFSQFYPSGLYSPYSLGENSSPTVLNMASGAPLNISGHKNMDKPDAESRDSSGKAPGNNSSQLHANLSDRRSPNIDYRSKFMPQQYYSYPYSNFHGFEQSPYALLSENPYGPGHGRVLADEKEREREHHTEQARKAKQPGEGIEGGMLTSAQIKQEPLERDRTYKDSGSGSAKHHSNQQVDDSLRKGGSNSSKHQKDYKKGEKEDKERDRHTHGSKGDSLGHKVGNSKSLGNHADRDKQNSRHSEGDSEKEKERAKNEGSKPTMETTGPPPPPTGSYAYIPPGYLQTSPFGIPFDPTHPLYRQVIVPGPYPGTPYSMHPGAIPRFPATPVSTPLPLPEDLSRPSPPTSAAGPTSKGLDLLQHHAAQYYATHKIHELQERALKSPSPQVPVTNSQHSGSSSAGNLSQTSKPSSPRSSSPANRKEPVINSGCSKSSEASKDVKPTIPASSANTLTGTISDTSRSPPTQHHVHSHTHHHTHIGYPIIPTVPPQYSPHYPHVIPPAAPPTPVIPPFSAQKPT